MFRATLPVLAVAGLLLAGCQSAENKEAMRDVRNQETQAQAIERIERDAAQQRAGRGP